MSAVPEDPLITTVAHTTGMALATGLGVGWVPFIPGTAGSLLGVYLATLLHRFTRPGQLTLAIMLWLIGIPLCAWAASELGQIDPAMIVFDEIIGLQFALLFIPRSGFAWGSAFLLFRCLDSIKPWPIHLAESWLSPGLGIMADDLLAGLMTLCLVHLGIGICQHHRNRGT